MVKEASEKIGCYCWLRVSPEATTKWCVAKTPRTAETNINMYSALLNMKCEKRKVKYSRTI